ncbi:hypothetical protein ACO0LO_21865 [Undibacterium sp. TJN25]|uniref:hypothetical protein n=1 Tax=Undibacterium sp. TJN25 TaxID=3413056 RepID=UPI003BF3FDDA
MAQSAITFCCMTKNGKQAKLAFGSDTPVSDPFSVTQQNAASRAGVRQLQRQPQLQSQKQRQPDSPFSKEPNYLKLSWLGVAVGVVFEFGVGVAFKAAFDFNPRSGRSILCSAKNGSEMGVV